MQVKLQPDRTGISSSLVQTSIDYFGSLLGLTCADWIQSPPVIICPLSHNRRRHRPLLQRAKLAGISEAPLHLACSCPLGSSLPALSNGVRNAPKQPVPPSLRGWFRSRGLTLILRHCITWVLARYGGGVPSPQNPKSMKY
jgi:hypothetical protein